MNNYQKQSYAKECARVMRANPSPLEEEMMEFLDEHHLDYVFQKIFYITQGDQIERFFIADFYFPSTHIILETDGQFHHKRVRQDAKRTDLLLTYYPEVRVIRWEWVDFKNAEKVRELLALLRDST